MILAGPHAGPQQVARFKTEAEAVARLQHPNIVQIHEVGEADGHPYCALEFVEGGNLAAKLDGTPMPARGGGQAGRGAGAGDATGAQPQRGASRSQAGQRSAFGALSRLDASAIACCTLLGEKSRFRHDFRQSHG
jgi:hypothetical protein